MSRGWLLRLVIALGFAQGAVSMARPAVSYRALSLGAGERGVGQPLSMTTVVRAAPDGARSTALALRLTGNRLGQVAAPASAGPVAGAAGVAAPFVLLGVLLVEAAGLGVRAGRRPRADAAPAPAGRRTARRRA